MWYLNESRMVRSRARSLAVSANGKCSTLACPTAVGKEPARSALEQERLRFENGRM